MTIWTCRNCDNKAIHHQGVPQHRAMHRRRQDGPVVMETWKYEYTYDYRPADVEIRRQS